MKKIMVLMLIIIAISILATSCNNEDLSGQATRFEKKQANQIPKLPSYQNLKEIPTLPNGNKVKTIDNKEIPKKIDPNIVNILLDAETHFFRINYTIKRGWNLIGVPGRSTGFSTIFPSELRITDIRTYDPEIRDYVTLPLDDHHTRLQRGKGYFIYSEMPEGEERVLTKRFTEDLDETSYDMELQRGWNLISYPFEGQEFIPIFYEEKIGLSFIRSRGRTTEYYPSALDNPNQRQIPFHEFLTFEDYYMFDGSNYIRNTKDTSMPPLMIYYMHNDLGYWVLVDETKTVTFYNQRAE